MSARGQGGAAGVCCARASGPAAWGSTRAGLGGRHCLPGRLALAHAHPAVATPSVPPTPRGADAAIKNAEGKAAGQVAEMNEQAAVVELLKGKGMSGWAQAAAAGTGCPPLYLLLHSLPQ